MNKQISIPTQKHHIQFAVNLLWLSICLFVTCIGVYGTIMKFKWEYLLVLAATILGVLYYGSAVWGYIFFEKLTIDVEVNGDEVAFQGRDEDGKETSPPQKINMANVARVYLRITHQKVIKYKSFEFQDKNSQKEAEEIYFLPDMYDVKEEDMNHILAFLKSEFPHIELGYEK